MLSLIQAAALCPPSDTGKHHWMIESPGAKPLGVCKYCRAERRFENSAGEGYWDYRARHTLAMRKYIEQMQE